MIQSYRDLIVWQEAMALTKQVYRLSASFPKTEVYGLTSQTRRCAVSIPSNIAEGHGRGSTKEYLRFLSIALGPLAELETQLTLASEFEYFPKETLTAILKSADVLGRQLRALQRSIKAKVK